MRVMRLKGEKKNKKQARKLLRRSSMVVLYLGLIDLGLSSCLVVSPPLPPAPLSISGPAFPVARARSWEEERRQHRPSKLV